MGNQVATNLYSTTRPSKLIDFFANRAGGPGSDAETALRKQLVILRKAVGWSRRRPQLEKALAARGILRTEYKTGWDRDGSIEPIGGTFDHGFKMTLNAKAPENRVRFTQAHELCHTFFYQYVPEIKFRPHAEDQGEERLCNFGAAELLMPENSLRKEARQLPRSIRSLVDLAAAYRVSPEAMMLRLRSLRLWNAELHFWQREASGEFVLDRIVGGKWRPWKWCDRKVPTDAWARGHLSGSSDLQCEVNSTHKQFRVISFDSKRQGNTLMTLTGASKADWRENRPLFHRTPKARARDAQAAGVAN
jgi:Zn-dependent peptidase ImmA (M78 family)